ncbi:ATP-binding protein [Streptomyces indicus]|uniref:Histidine kinase-like ATPase domain-containing protein n=1 Tax=Streptomyces indicus TaxID=417292 RepID=A0A1G9CKS1_9ACTN|nr:ATP-binding protein [Streptomyces indicus]SDK52035.1 Histidine kinase-like ATPase domain-containing protein [Streptomyces indicus]
MTLTVGAHSARPLRHILRLHLRAWEQDGLADAAELALTELVSNVVRHVPGAHCTIRILCREHGVRVEVEDGLAALPAAPGGEGDGTAELAEDSRGLLLIDAVTDRWGADPLPGGRGKTVWFECGLPQS